MIGKATKFCDLIAIGHGTKIGQHCLFVAQVGVAGSVVVGNHAFFGAREKDNSPFLSFALMHAAQPRGFVLRRGVDLLAHGQRVEPFGEAKVGPLRDSPQAADDS